MSNCPNGHCVCRTLQNQSYKIWQDLGDANSLNSPLHEVSITQYLTLTLNKLHPNNVKVHSFKPAAETANGCDFLWIIVSPSGAQCVKLAIQAKRLYGDGTYKAFKASQVAKVMNYAKVIGAYGMYMTYNFDVIFPAHLLWRNWLHRLPLQLCFMPRDVGLALIHAGNLASANPAVLRLDEVANFGFPAWLPFCICSNTQNNSGSPLKMLNKILFSLGEFKTEEDSYIQDWRDGEKIDPLVDQAIEDDDRFDPAFALITKLEAGSHLD